MTLTVLSPGLLALALALADMLYLAAGGERMLHRRNPWPPAPNERLGRCFRTRVIAAASRLPRSVKRLIMVASDGVMMPLLLYVAIALRLGTFEHGIAGEGWLYLLVVCTAVPVFAKLGLYRAVVRYVGEKTMAAVVLGVTLSTALLLLLNPSLTHQALPAEALVIYWPLALLYLAGSRFLVRAALRPPNAAAQRVAIYGAGEAGIRLSMALRGDRDFDPILFIDDEPNLRGSVIGGLEVSGPDALPDVLRERGITTVLLALPSAPCRRRHEILRRLETLAVCVRTVPDLAEIASGRARIENVREIDVRDLLGREPVLPDTRLLLGSVRGKSVLVTGAGGSIGSELCRQIIRLPITRLVLLEVSESALYSIDKELRLIKARERPQPEIVALLGNAHHEHRMREIMESFKVQTVYHAAAYKHVPIVEQNMIEGIHNNVIATWNTAESALAAGVETFVLVSTDKAVHPSSIMGATKRFAELVLQGLQHRGAATRFCMVRFGNVLASSGSVVPLFKEQIARGGPLTVTHPDVSRYFMTVSEAAQLVIQASSMAKGGDVFVLDMGEPVRIGDLARRMVNLTGFTVRDEEHPDGDIEIEYTGLRPGEKLREELLIGGPVIGTEHPMIMRSVEHSLRWEHVHGLLKELMDALQRYDCRRARELLLDAVSEYHPTPSVEDLVSQALADTAPAAEQ